MNNPAQKPGGIIPYFCQDRVTGSDLDHRRPVDRFAIFNSRARDSPLVKRAHRSGLRDLLSFSSHAFTFHDNELGR